MIFFFKCLCSFEAKFDSWSSKCWFGPLVCQLHSRRLGKPTVANDSLLCRSFYADMTLVLSTFCHWHSFTGCWMHDSRIITHSFLVWAGESTVQTTVLGFTTKDFVPTIHSSNIHSRKCSWWFSMEVTGHAQLNWEKQWPFLRLREQNEETVNMMPE